MDDEPLALINMEKRLKEFDSIEIVKSFTTLNDLLNEGPTLDIQVAFLDVEMPGMNGLEIAQLLKQWHKNIYIIFVTAYRDYAVQAFEIQSLDYLLKPISKSRLETTINRIQELFQHEKTLLPAQKNTEPSLQIQCFGGFNVSFNNKIVHWRTAKTKELFAFLFSNLYSHIPRDTIIDALWAETEYKKARVQLHTTISYLRTTLSALGYVNVLHYTNGCYTLQLENFQCDALDLEQLLKQKEVTGALDIELAEKFIQNHHHGDYMATLDYPWINNKTNFFNNLFTILLSFLVEHYTATYAVKKRELTLLLSLDFSPYSDKIIQQLLQHYIEVDNRANAIRIYNTFRSNLKTDLGILPNQDTVELFNNISEE
ncbi:response regulator [Lysinibacillus sphaericus]|uniref:Response regulatory protein n=1 Tax=Lysinibacillus sphaericus OT4b.31 TaxID=1285586 RepID=R7ZI64_LYSSH|nr:response regulator [Lysinibacillus sphaericus]EON73773.1 response regulatory protein [Lysinibacillus sphaericus OT4b.31]